MPGPAANCKIYAEPWFANSPTNPNGLGSSLGFVADGLNQDLRKQVDQRLYGSVTVVVGCPLRSSTNK
ncbi:MAG: hypothetical protein M1835_006534, partial [Candelina submexicana]